MLEALRGCLSNYDEDSSFARSNPYGRSGSFGGRAPAGGSSGESTPFGGVVMEGANLLALQELLLKITAASPLPEDLPLEQHHQEAMGEVLRPLQEGELGFLQEGELGFLQEGEVGFLQEGGVGFLQEGEVGFLQEGEVGFLREGGGDCRPRNRGS